MRFFSCFLNTFFLISQDNGGAGDYRRLRTYLPLLEHYCKNSDSSSTLRVFRDMQQSPGVHFDSEAYALVISSLARSNVFAKDNEAIEGAALAGFKATRGPDLFDELVREMADDILELSEASSFHFSGPFFDPEGDALMLKLKLAR